MSTEINQALPSNIRNALLAGSSPSAGNPFITASALPSFFGYVPYTGATSNVNLGAFSLTTPLIRGVNGALSFGNVTQLSGAVTNFTFTAANHTGQTAGANIQTFQFTPGILQRYTGAVATSQTFVISSPTYSFSGASTITNAYTLYVEAPTAGANATITNNWAAGFNGNVEFSVGSTGIIKIKNNSVNYLNLGPASFQFFNAIYTAGIYARTGSGNYGNIFGNGQCEIFATSASGIILGSPNAIPVGFATNNLLRARFESTGNLLFQDGINISFNATTGTKIGTATTQKLSFWNATPIVQPTTGVASATFVANAGTAVNDASTFDGYTVGQIVKALRNTGLLA